MIVEKKWIRRHIINDTKQSPIDLVVCPECWEEFSFDYETGIGMDDYNFCPNCGANMLKKGKKQYD